jgi:hypothetical protein
MELKITLIFDVSKLTRHDGRACCGSRTSSSKPLLRLLPRNPRYSDGNNTCFMNITEEGKLSSIEGSFLAPCNTSRNSRDKLG